MASSTLRSGAQGETGVGVLPIDLVFEILIRLSAAELCRLRVVCQPWGSLLSDPQFIAAHATRHPRPLFVAGHGKSDPDDGILCRIMDLSGRVIKQIRSKKDEWLISTQCNLACVAKGTPKRCQLLNLVTGERFPVPEGLSPEHTPRKLEFSNHKVSVAFGQVASTGEFKLLRVVDKKASDEVRREQLCEVFTHGGSRGSPWRGKKAAQDHVNMSPLSRVAIDGIVYFLLDEYVSSRDVRPKGIASFDLLTEEWRAILRGPVSILAKGRYGDLSLAALNGSLVLVHSRPYVSMDLWFLMDFEKGLWVKQHTVKVNLSVLDGFRAHPLVILKNGSIVIYIGSRRSLRIYNPRTNTYRNVAKMVSSEGIALYTGNLLSIANDAI
ncbi:hypothetical protein BDA96_02G071500 [Sorghum bicolor]|uniref:F-box domain-containing protein n=2 Tax=Sorghum bicolor TaxID=4558 RepID=A0A1B6Q9M1_SORBI|nr:putative F-box protein At1g47765 [Sorghum bicolor]KAG0542070.1 hypothetical protein BDA96_02G071500 [Sorghum bicolor]KXG34627.1 hypothetical protein SORBI_3002G070000 [Sorghum bicolor]KXG34628.1 hypothetical protein SORBI_3002G070000 [Sorghum bicolor]OQU88663.1 hypothetical protein SORBI_3002G070000 [Sorghum bicolor]|eukprot:XP_021308341.1 putative F-box protein At1g47765 [Sorghum bicolor]